MTPARLRTYARSWTVTTAAQVVPMVLVAGLMVTLHPVAAIVGGILLLHAWAIPELYANRGAKVVKPRVRTDAAAEATALGFLGDLIGHDARALHARTGLVMERGAREYSHEFVGRRGRVLGTGR